MKQRNSTLSRLIQETKAQHKMFGFAMLFMMLDGLANVLPSWIVKISIDGLAALEHGLKTFDLLPTQVHKMFHLSELRLETANLVVFLPVLIVLVFAFEGFCKFLYQFQIRNIGILASKDLREKFHAHLNKLSLSTQAKYESGSLVSIVSSDLNNLQSWLAESISNVFNDGFKALFLFFWLLVIDWKLTLITAFVLPLFALPVSRLGKSIRNYSRRGQDSIGTIGTFIAETLANQRVIKSYRLEDWRNQQFAKESDNLTKLNQKWVFYMALVSPLTNIVGAIGISLILFLGLKSVIAANISVGEFSSFFVTSILLYDPIKRIGRVATIIQSALGVADRVFELLDEEQQELSSNYQQDTRSQKLKPNLRQDSKLQGSELCNNSISQQINIKFDNVSFSYPGRKVFQDLNFEIKDRTSLALVGQSGGGKTTLVSLIPRFYEIESGAITLNGRDIASMPLEELRSHIALVTQEPLLFSGTIRENICLSECNAAIGDLGASEQRLDYAMRAAHVTEFASKIGLDTYIGERGANLSLGQKQRIALARAFYSQAPLIILDEPTSALDNESQSYVQDAIDKLMSERTIVIIAHRLSTVRKCDRIIYIDNGEIRETGSHEELANSESAYAKLLE